MALPAFLQQANLPPSPYQKTIGGALGQVGAIQQIRAREQEMARQKAMAPLQQQLLQEQVKEIPIKEKLTRAQAEKLMQEAQRPYDPKDPISVYNYGQKLFDQNPDNPIIPMLGNYINQMSTPKAGITMGTDPSGKTSIQIGGQQMFPGVSPFGTPMVNPVTKAARGAKGATYADQQTGKMYSSLTNQETTNLQKSVLGDKQLKNIVDTMVNDVNDVDFFNPVTHARAWASKFTKGFDPEAGPIASHLLGLQNKATAAAERLMTFTNAPRTEEMMHRAIAVFMPNVGENEKSYRQRVTSNMGLFMKNAEVAKEALQKGTPLGEMPYKMVQLPPKTWADYVHPHYVYVKTAPGDSQAQAAPMQTQPQAAPQGTIKGSDGQFYTREQLQAIAGGSR